MKIQPEILTWEALRAREEVIGEVEMMILLSGYFTRQERKVLLTCTQDCSNQEIAEILGIAESTVKVHKRTISRKMDIHGQVEFRKFLVWVRRFL